MKSSKLPHIQSFRWSLLTSCPAWEPQCKLDSHSFTSPLLRAQLNMPQHGDQLQRRCYLRYRTFAFWQGDSGLTDTRRGQQNDNRSIHRQSSYGQAYTSTRHDLVLSIRICGRYAGYCGYRSLPTGHVWDPKWRATNHTGCGSDVPGAVL